MSLDTLTYIIPMKTEKYVITQLEYLLPGLFMMAATGNRDYLNVAIENYCNYIPISDTAQAEEGDYRRNCNRLIEDVVPIFNLYLNDVDRELIQKYTRNLDDIDIEVMNKSIIRISVVSAEKM